MGITVSGVARTLSALNGLSETVNSGVEDGLEKVARTILKRSKKIVPTENADLKRSGEVEVEDGTAYIRYTQEYALIQHENLDYSHDAGEQAKYLEEPYVEVMTSGKAADLLANHLQSILGL